MSIFNEDIFQNLFEQAQINPTLRTLDPLNELLSKPLIRIPYQRKVKKNAGSAFMVFTRKNRNWLELLVRDLTTIHTAFQADATVMLSKSSAKRSNGKQQTWEDFIVELYADKVSNRNDFSEGQMRHLVALIDELRSNGQRLKAAGQVEFYDMDTGDTL